MATQLMSPSYLLHILIQIINVTLLSCSILTYVSFTAVTSNQLLWEGGFHQLQEALDLKPLKTLAETANY